MKKPKYLVIIETPFQLLCAIEYIKQKEITPDIIVRKSRVGENDRQLDSMLKDLRLESSLIIEVKPKSKLDPLKAAFKVAPLLTRKYEKIIIGSYFSGVQRKIASTLKPREIVLLDDGVASILADKIIEAEEPNKYSAFSIFTLNKNNYKTTEKNDFKGISSIYNCRSKENLTCFFIGQKLVDIGALSIDEYTRSIEYCIRKIGKEETLNYIPHRTESRENLEKIRRIKGVNITEVNSAIEYHLLKNNIYPKKVYSIISTALYSIATIYPETETTCIQPKNLKSEMFEHYSDVIKAFSEHQNKISFAKID